MKHEKLGRSPIRVRKTLKLALEVRENLPEVPPLVTPSDPPKPNSLELPRFARKIYDKVISAMREEDMRSRLNQLLQLGEMVAPYSTNEPFLSYLSQFKVDQETGVILFPKQPPTYHLPSVKNYEPTSPESPAQS